MTCNERAGQEEPDNQMVFDFYKEVASAKEVANNESVKVAFEQGTAEVKRMSGAWEEAYEAGFRAGMKAGEKKAFAQAGLKIERVL